MYPIYTRCNADRKKIEEEAKKGVYIEYRNSEYEERGDVEARMWLQETGKKKKGEEKE